MRSRTCLSMLLCAGIWVLAGGCGPGGSSSPEKAAPTFCPAPLAQRLEVAPESGNVPPRAYYQRLVAEENTALSITLYACDPNDATTSRGLYWRQPDMGGEEGPFNGTLSAYSGTYPEDGIISYTPNSGFIGSDSFMYLVSDGIVDGNTAQIRISVTETASANQRLYFSGNDDSYRAHLWSLDTNEVLSTVQGSAQALSNLVAGGVRIFQQGIVYNDLIYFIGTPSEGTYLISFEPSTRAFQYYSQIDEPGELALYNGFLYATGMAAGTSTSYLWERGGGGWNPVPGTENIWPYDLTVFNGKLFFRGDAGGGNSQLMSYDSAGGTLALETDIGSNLGPMYLTVYNSRLYFNGSFGGAVPTEYLWSYDGTNTASTVTPRVTQPSGLIVFDGKLYFSASDALMPTDGPQLWSFNSSGSILSKWSNVPGILGLFLDYPMGLNNMLYFRGYDGSNTYLYSHDGSSPIETVPGTQDFYPFYPAVFNGRIYYNAHTFTDFYDELWTYDPDSNSVSKISSISMGLSPRGFVVYPP